jgi:hypothetical protein
MTAATPSDPRVASGPSDPIDARFRVDLIAATPNPQQCVYAAMHQDYSEGYVADDRAAWPEEGRAGEICVKRLLAGERGHYGPLEHAQIVLNVGWFPHSVMQQARTHRVGVSFDVQSMRYTGDRICRAGNGELDLEEVFYLRPIARARSTATPLRSAASTWRSAAPPRSAIATCWRPASRRNTPAASCRSTTASTSWSASACAPCCISSICVPSSTPSWRSASSAI